MQYDEGDKQRVGVMEGEIKVASRDSNPEPFAEQVAHSDEDQDSSREEEQKESEGSDEQSDLGPENEESEEEKEDPGQDEQVSMPKKNLQIEVIDYQDDEPREGAQNSEESD